MPSTARLAAILRSLHWRRGLRAGFAVATAMIVCRLLHHPMGWAALGGFEATLVDNGGPYRSRLNTIATVIFGGALCGIIGTLVPQNLFAAAVITAIVCFAVTFARVASQPIANTAVIILVIYFAGFGSADRTLPAALSNTSFYILGGLWAAAISLFLWPVDPFRPARLEVAACYDLLADFTANLHTTAPTRAAHDDDHAHAVDFKRQLRRRIEQAHAALSATAARAPVRTVRARNLSVLLETVDQLFAATVRLTELAEFTQPNTNPGADPAPISDIAAIAHNLNGAERAIARNLRTRPADNAASFGPKGSHRLQYIIRPSKILPLPNPADPLQTHLIADQRDALQNIEIAFEAVRALWIGAETRPADATIHSGTPSTTSSGAPSMPESHPGIPGSPQASLVGWMGGIYTPDWLDALRQNVSLDSIMFRHALRMAVVGAVDVILIRAFHINHGFWLAMTSIIVLQPYSVGVVRKSFQRVAGTVGGGILAAILAAVIHTETGIIAVISICSVLTLATYAVDYAWFAFFLTPTFVLMSLPHLRDWSYAGVRILNTVLGAIVAIIAMRVLWPQSPSLELSRLLSRSASALAAYLRAVLRFWATPATERTSADRQILAPARRACGLTSQDAEEALDRILLEPSLPGLASSRAPSTESALTFTTYIRRFTQCLTTLAFVGSPDARTVVRLEQLNHRLAAICALLDHQSDCASTTLPPAVDPATPAPLIDPNSLAEQMLQRMERQAGILERAAAAIVSPSSSVAEQLASA
jgi:uncharacterized membrane protein YccC